MKVQWIVYLAMITWFTSCEPALYLTIENHTGGAAAILFNFDEANSFFNVEAGEEKIFDFTSTTINASTELSFGSGNWNGETLNQLTKGINRIILTAKNSTIIIEDEEEIYEFFNKRVIGKSHNGIRVVIQ